jgi:hypothetical protein
VDLVLALVVAAVFAVPLLILGLVALVRARPEDIPAVVRALASWGRKLGADRRAAKGDPAPAGSPPRARL